MKSIRCPLQALLAAMIFVSFPFLVPTVHAQISFATPVEYATGMFPISIIAGDFNGDGHSDLATGNRSATVSVLLNAGDGTFGAVNNTIIHGLPIGITSGDLDGDGDLDIATANLGSEDVSVLLNNGDGTIGAPAYYNVGAHADGVTAVDLDGNGTLDLAVNTGDFDVQENNTVAILLNNGDGTFSPAVNYPNRILGDHDVAAGDLDSDGDADLAVTNRDNSTISLYFNHGDGTFPPAVILSAIDAPVSVLLADLDTDGALDLVTANFFNTVAIFQNHGDGTFAALESYPIGGIVLDVTEVDLDSDGVLDLAVTNDSGNTITVLRNPGDGSLMTLGTIPTGCPPISEPDSCPSHIASADLNGNTTPDLATAHFVSHTVAVLLTQAGPVLNPENGHYYDAIAVPEGLLWTEAKTAAESRVFLGVPGHLATITSQSENDFIVNAFPEAAGTPYWLGGFQPAGTPEPSEGWEWVTEESFSYTNWAPGEPNDPGGGEDFLAFWPPAVGQWDDVGPGRTLGYVVEYPLGCPVVGYTLTVSRNDFIANLDPDDLPAGLDPKDPRLAFNIPNVSLSNLSMHASITDFRMTIGDSTFNFDSLGTEFGSPPQPIAPPSDDVGFALLIPDNDNLGGVRADTVHLSFTGFEPGEFFGFAVDIDENGRGDTIDERFSSVLFDLDGTDARDNARVTVTFSDGRILFQSLPDFMANLEDTYSITQSVCKRTADLVR